MKRALSPPTTDIATSAALIEFVNTKRLDAQRRRDDNQAKIEALITDKQRANDDHSRALSAIDAEIAEVQADVTDAEIIIHGAEAFLASLDRPAPVLSSSNVVKQELGK